MAWTREQLAKVEEAIFKLATGAQSYSIGGRTVTRAGIEDLYRLRDRMRAELGDMGPRVLRGRLVNP